MLNQLTCKSKELQIQTQNYWVDNQTPPKQLFRQSMALMGQKL